MWIAGLGSLAWFLLRVIPKPSRATYPCQRAAFPVASSFLIYIAGLLGARMAWVGAEQRWRQRRWVLAGLLLVAAAGGLLVSEGVGSRSAPAAAFVPVDGPNNPMGIGKGIYPGRVVWAHEPDATTWSPAWNTRSDIHYWDDEHTDQELVSDMMRRCLQTVTGETNQEAAWDALFRHFNEQRGRGPVGYQAGERVFIKVNHVEHRSHNDVNNYADQTPQVEVALLDQVVEKAGVPEAMITMGDPSRFVTDKTFTRLHARRPDVTYIETSFYNLFNNPGTAGRVMITPSATPMIIYSGKDIDGAAIASSLLPMEMVEADYIINLAVMKGHNDSGVTLNAKNWYGCFCTAPGIGPHNSRASSCREYGQYRLLTDLMAHEHLGGKTMLFILDGLYGFGHHGSSSRPVQWANAPFNGDYPSSLLMSQDPVALESVGLDFLRTEFGDNMGDGGRVGDAAIDDHMHEAALIANAPSGTVYDPEGDGTTVTLSLGVHEHWNNPVDKLYSRNLGTGVGIELIKVADNGIADWTGWR
jgi:hypothetical protein